MRQNTSEVFDAWRSGRATAEPDRPENLWDHYETEAWQAYCDNFGYEYDDGDVVSDFEEAYSGAYRDGEEFAETLAEDLGLAPDPNRWPLYCIDWKRAARDLFMGDYWSDTIDGTTYVFRST